MCFDKLSSTFAQFQQALKEATLEKDKNDVKRKRQMTIHDMFSKSQK